MSKTTDDLLKQLSNVNTLSELKKYAASSNGASHPLSLHECLFLSVSQQFLSANLCAGLVSNVIMHIRY